MKTKMLCNDSRTLEDIVFEDRNQAYGAYAMNKNRWKYLLIAFFITLAGVSTAVAVPFIKAMKSPGLIVLPGKDVQITLNPVKPDPVIPPPPPPDLPNSVEKAIYQPPLIVDNPEEGNDMDIMNNVLATTTNDPPPVDYGTIVPQAIEIEEPDKTEYLQPEEQASFMKGDLSEFRIWVQKNIIYPDLAIQHQIFGKVIVGFCVNSKGQVVDVNIIRGVDPSIDQETIRVISSSPLWRAARQGGQPVKQKFIIPVTYLLNN